jgi:iron complex outermembrane recepter protein
MKVVSMKVALCCSAAAIALTLGSGAHAQQTATTTASNADTIETVTVTASRRSETVQNVGGALTALTGADLAAMHANSFTDFAAQVPSLSYFSAGPTTDQIVLRGVTSGSVEKGNTVGVYIDDVPIGSSTQFGIGSYAANPSLFDMDRVEILDGPQGTLYGANSMGGAIKYITAKPELGVYDAKAQAEGSDTEHGSFNEGLRLMANIPLFGDNVALRVDGIQQFDSGYAQDPDDGRKNVGAARTFSGRASLLAQLTPDIDVRLTALTQHDYANGYDAVLKDFTTHQPIEGPYDQSYQALQPSEKDLEVYSAVVNWDFHWSKLTSVTSYQNNETRTDGDVSPVYNFILLLYGVDSYKGIPEASPTIPLSLPTSLHTRKFTQELRLASSDNKHFEWVVGGYYTREITDELIELVDPQTANGQLPGYNFQDTNVPSQAALPFYGSLPSSYKELAAFADATYYVTDNFDIGLGARYSVQHQNFQSYLQTFLFPATPETVLHYPIVGGVYKTNQGAATYLINPRYHVTEDTMIYAKVSSGYEPGGSNFVFPGNAAPPQFQSASLWNYELGEKSTLLDGKAILNFDIYDIEWQGIQTTANIGGINQLINAGNARVEGAETSFSYRILQPLTVGGSASYTNAFLTNNTPYEQNYLGVYSNDQRLPLSPRWSFALNGTYTFDLGGGYSGSANLNDVYVGSRNSAFNVPPSPGQFLFQGAPNYKLASYNTVNANLSFFLPHNLELDLYLKNVFDVQGEVSANPFQAQYLNPYMVLQSNPYPAVPVTLSQPRTVGLVLKVGLN